MLSTLTTSAHPFLQDASQNICPVEVISPPPVLLQRGCAFLHELHSICEIMSTHRSLRYPTLVSFCPFNSWNLFTAFLLLLYTVWKVSQDSYFLNGCPIDPGLFLRTSFPENISVVALPHTVACTCVWFCFCISQDTQFSPS